MAMRGETSIDTGFLEAITKYPIVTRNGCFMVNFVKRLTEYGDEILSMRIYVSNVSRDSTVVAYDVQNSVHLKDDKRIEEHLLRLISQVFSAMDIPLREIPLNLHKQSDVTNLVYKWRLEHGI
jgi:hypothetical protein